MTIFSILILCIIALIASVYGVTVGGISLITVPLLISFGMLPKQAIATNMFALIFLSISGSFGFRKKIKPEHLKMVIWFSFLAVLGSLPGALLVFVITNAALKIIIAVMLIVVAILSLLKKDFGIIAKPKKINLHLVALGTILVFILSIYGGFLSGGYVTMLSYVLILLFGMEFLEVAFITKILNIFSSLAASILFYRFGLIDLYIGVPLALSMSLGALAGAKLAIAKGNIWIRNIFIAATILLAVKILLF